MLPLTDAVPNFKETEYWTLLGDISIIVISHAGTHTLQRGKNCHRSTGVHLRTPSIQGVSYAYREQKAGRVRVPCGAHRLFGEASGQEQSNARHSPVCPSGYVYTAS
jgi:hypothetical protein